MEEDHDQANQKRLLKKVRRHFLARRPDDQDHPDSTPALDFPTDDKTTCYNPLGEENKTYLEAMCSPDLNIEKIIVEGEEQSLAVTLHLRSNGENTLRPRKSLSYQCEIYGDLNFGTWAMYIQEYHTLHPDVIEKYFALLRSADPDVYSNLRKAKRKAIEAQRNIAKKYPFRKVTTYSNNEISKLLSCSYSEKLFAELGYELTPFVEWIKENGFPTLFESDCTVHINMTLAFLDALAAKGDAFLEGPEYTTYCLDKNGNKIPYLAQFLTVVEPFPDGVFGHFYVILKQRLENLNDAKLMEKDNFKDENEHEGLNHTDESENNAFH